MRLEVVEDLFFVVQEFYSLTVGWDFTLKIKLLGGWDLVGVLDDSGDSMVAYSGIA